MNKERFHLTMVSGNSKTGPIPVSTSPSATCPDACPLKNKGCYAQQGQLAIHWRKVSEGTRGVTWSKFLKEVRSIADSTLFRHNQAGDIPGSGDTIDAKRLDDLTKAAAHTKAFTYTHYPPTARNKAAIKKANASGFTINLSADSTTEADELAALGIGPVVVVLPEDAPKTSTTPAGRRIVVCPAQTKDDVTCDRCRLCAKPDRSFIIGFRAHGAKRKQVSRACYTATSTINS